MLVKADDDDREKDQERQARGDKNVAGNREEIRKHAEHVAGQDEHEQGEDERKKPHALRACRVAQHSCNELIGQFRHGLHAPRHQTTASGRQHEERRDADHRKDHEQCLVGEGDCRAPELAEFNQIGDGKLMDRINLVGIGR